MITGIFCGVQIAKTKERTGRKHAMYSTCRGSSAQGSVLKERRQESVRGQYMVTHDLRSIETQNPCDMICKRMCGFDSLIYTTSESKQDTAFLFDEDFSHPKQHLPLSFFSFLPFSCASCVFPAGSPSRMMTLMHEKRTVLLLLANLLLYDTTYHYFHSCFQMRYLPVCVLKLCIINNYQLQYLDVVYSF